MDIKKNIKQLWENECLLRTRDDILFALARDGRLPLRTALSVRQRYFYDQKFSERDGPIILEIMHNALREQNSHIDKIIS